MSIDEKYLEDVQEELTLYKAYKHAYNDVIRQNEKYKELMDRIFRLTACDYTRDCIAEALEEAK